MNTKLTMVGDSNQIRTGAVLQMLEAEGATGIFKCNGRELRLTRGMLVKVKTVHPQFGGAIDVMEDVLDWKGKWTWRSTPYAPHGNQHLSLTGAILEVLRLQDERKLREASTVRKADWYETGL